MPTAADIWSTAPSAPAAPSGMPATAIWGPAVAPKAPAPGTTAAAGDPTDPTSLAAGYGAEGIDPDLSNSLIHNVMKPFHNMAMGVENGLAWLGDKIDPKTGNTLSSTITGQQQRSGWNQKLQDTVNSDRQAMKDWEAQYQRDQPDNVATKIGATVGTVLPFAAGGGALGAVGKSAAELLPAAAPALVKKIVSGATQGVVAAPAVTSGGSDTYGKDLLGNAEAGAAGGAVVPVAAAGLKWGKDQVTGLWRPIMSPSTEAAQSMTTLARNAAAQGDADAEAAAKVRAAASGQKVVPPIEQPQAVMEAQQQPAGAPGALLTPKPTTPTVADIAGLLPGEDAGIAPLARPGDNFDPNSILPGWKPTPAQIYGGADLTQAEAVARNDKITAPLFKGRDAENDAARWAALKSQTASEDQLLAAKKARDEATAPLRNAVFQNPVDPAPVLAQLTALRQSSFGTNPQVAGAISDLDASIKQGIAHTQARFPGAPPGTVAPDLLDGYRQNLRAFLSKNASDGVVASRETAAMMPVKQGLENAIEAANPGYKDYLKTYAQMSQPINSAEAANGIRDYFINRPFNANQQPKMTLTGMNAALRAASNEEYGLTPQAQQVMEGIRKTLQQETLSNAALPAGSPTALHLSSPTWLASKMLTKEGPLGDVPWIGKHIQGVGDKVAAARAQILMDPNRFSALATQGQDATRKAAMVRALMQGAPGAAAPGAQAIPPMQPPSQ